MSVTVLKPQRERKPGPYKARRRCSTCRCFLSQNNPSDYCAPCSGGDWISPEATEAEIHSLREERLQELGVAA